MGVRRSGSVRFKSSNSHRSGSARSPRPEKNRRLIDRAWNSNYRIEELESRILLSAYMQLQTVQAFAAGQNALLTQVNNIASQAFGTDISLTAQTLSQALGLNTDIQNPFKSLTLDTNSSTNLTNELMAAGFVVLVPFDGNVHSNGGLSNLLLELSYAAQV